MSPSLAYKRLNESIDSTSNSWFHMMNLMHTRWLQQEADSMETIRLQTLQVLLHDNRIEYETGDMIQGRCVVAIEGKLLRRHINILFTCVGEIKWYEAGAHNRYHYHDVHEFHDKKVFMELLYKHPPECEHRTFVFLFFCCLQLVMNRNQTEQARTMCWRQECTASTLSSNCLVGEFCPNLIVVDI